MSILLFKLRGVPDDEAEEVRELLTAHKIEYYETTAGSWGISLPAIWLHDKDQLEQAQTLLTQYQEERAQKAREIYAEQCRQGTQRTILTLFLESPVKWLVYISAILFVLYLATVPVTFLFQ